MSFKNFKIPGTNRPNPDCIEISALMVHSLGLIYLADFPLTRGNMLDFAASNSEDKLVDLQYL